MSDTTGKITKVDVHIHIRPPYYDEYVLMIRFDIDYKTYQLCQMEIGADGSYQNPVFIDGKDQRPNQELIQVAKVVSWLQDKFT